MTGEMIDVESLVAFMNPEEFGQRIITEESTRTSLWRKSAQIGLTTNASGNLAIRV